MTELVEVIIEELVVKLKYALREEEQNQEDIGQQVGKEFNFFMVLKKEWKEKEMDYIITTGCCSTRKLWTAKWNKISLLV